MHLFARIQMRRAAVAVLSLSLSIPLRIRPFRSPSHRTAYLARSLASLTHSKNVYAFADTLTLFSLPFFPNLFFFFSSVDGGFEILVFELEFRSGERIDIRERSAVGI